METTIENKLEKGMLFDLYQEGEEIKRVMAINETDVIVLSDQTIICDIDFENEVDKVLIDNIIYYGNDFI